MIRRGLRLPRVGFSALPRAKKLSSPHFGASFASGVSKGGLAAVVPKKVAVHSVDRHLLKRRILAVLAPYARPHEALVVFAKAGSPCLSYAAIQRELQELLGKLGRPA